MSTTTPPLTAIDAIQAFTRVIPEGALPHLPVAVLVRRADGRSSAHLVTDIRVINGQLWVEAETDVEQLPARTVASAIDDFHARPATDLRLVRPLRG